LSGFVDIFDEEKPDAGGRQLPKTNALGLSGGNVSAIAALSYLVNLLEIGEGNSCVVTMKLALIRAWDQHRPELFADLRLILSAGKIFDTL
jgi:hypothetical protein